MARSCCSAVVGRYKLARGTRCLCEAGTVPVAGGVLVRVRRARTTCARGGGIISGHQLALPARRLFIAHLDTVVCLVHVRVDRAWAARARLRTAVT